MHDDYASFVKTIDFYYDANGNLESKRRSEYDKAGNCILDCTYNSKNILIEKDTYAYKSKDVMSYWVTERYNEDGTLKTKDFPIPDATKDVSYEYEVLSDKTIKIRGIHTKKTSLTIPATIDGYKVSGINLNYHETDAKKIQSITIPNSVTEIGEYAFRGCTSLKSLTLPNGVTKIGEAAFLDCSSLTSITLPQNVISLGTHAFSGCESLKTITIPGNVSSIGQAVFSNCTSLVSVSISKGVSVIGQWMFSGCTSLTSVTIPNSVTSIGMCAFEDCTALKDVWYNGSEEDASCIKDGWHYENDMIYKATWHYNS